MSVRPTWWTLVNLALSNSKVKCKNYRKQCLHEYVAEIALLYKMKRLTISTSSFNLIYFFPMNSNKNLHKLILIWGWTYCFKHYNQAELHFKKSVVRKFNWPFDNFFAATIFICRIGLVWFCFSGGSWSAGYRGRLLFDLGNWRYFLFFLLLFGRIFWSFLLLILKFKG